MSNVAFVVALNVGVSMYGCGRAGTVEINGLEGSVGFVVSYLSMAAHEDLAEVNGVGSTATGSTRDSWVSSCSVISIVSETFTISALSNSSLAGVSLGILSGTFQWEMSLDS